MTEIMNGLLQQIAEIGIGQGHAGGIHAELCCYFLHRTQNHFRVLHKIPVHNHAVCGLTGFCPRGHLLRRCAALLQEQNIGGNIGSCVGLKCVVRQTDCTEQVGTFCHQLTRGGIDLIERSFGGDKRHDTARTHLVQRLNKEIVVDKQMIFVIAAVWQLVIAKRYIADSNIERVIRKLGIFVAGDLNIGVRVQLAGNASADAVQFYAGELALCHTFRQHTKEIADTHGWLQHPAAVKTHLTDCIIHGADNRRRGVVRVKNGCACGLVLVLCKSGTQLIVSAIARTERICHAAPADILREHLLFLGSCRTIRGFKGFQQTDSRDITFELFTERAGAECIIRDAEALRGRMLRRVRQSVQQLLHFTGIITRKADGVTGAVIGYCIVDTCRSQLRAQNIKLCCRNRGFHVDFGDNDLLRFRFSRNKRGIALIQCKKLSKVVAVLNTGDRIKQ